MKNKRYLTKALLATVMAIFSFLATATAQCVIPIAPGQSYIENFDSGEMECWTVESIGSATWAVMQGTSTNVMAFQNASAGDEALLVSPTFDLSGSSSATFSFGYAMMGFYESDELTVSYRTSPADSWHQLDSYSLSDWTNSYDASFTLDDLSSTFQVSFLGHCNGGFYIFIDDVEITSVGGCARPMNLQATEITAFSALLGWTTVGNEENWTIDMNGHQFTVTSQPYLMENLDPNTEYVVRVKANCGEGLESEWSYPMTFTTLCDVITVTDDLPYFDDFEASDDFVCWQNEIVSGIDGWVIDPGYLILNNTAFFIWMGGVARLVSAPLDITAVTHPTLTFRHKQLMEYNSLVDELTVWYRTDETEEWQLLEAYADATDDWVTETLVLPNPSATYQINFEAVGMNARGIYVDDVEVGNAHSTIVAEEVAIKASISPNPTTGKVQVMANVAEGEVAVFDVFGKRVAFASIFEGRAEIDLGAFASGVYMVRISCATGTTMMKLMRE